MVCQHLANPGEIRPFPREGRDLICIVHTTLVLNLDRLLHCCLPVLVVVGRGVDIASIDCTHPFPDWAEARLMKASQGRGELWSQSLCPYIKPSPPVN